MPILASRDPWGDLLLRSLGGTIIFVKLIDLWPSKEHLPWSVENLFKWAPTFLIDGCSSPQNGNKQEWETIFASRVFQSDVLTIWKYFFSSLFNNLHKYFGGGGGGGGHFLVCLGFYFKHLVTKKCGATSSQQPSNSAVVTSQVSSNPVQFWHCHREVSQSHLWLKFLVSHFMPTW